ncbi:50S ribosomal protein L16 [Candidatus Cyrtobacter comes]|nr:50S ribosomal protein L16 [Candidatus Cyrtobacter comes]
MLSPKKTKYRKAFKGRVRGITKGGARIAFGEYGLKAIGCVRLTARQIESARKAINNYLKRAGKLWIRVFPDLPVTKKPADVRMGSGKGSVEFWGARIECGRILFELSGVTKDQAAGAFERAAAKLPVKTKFVEKIGGDI